MDLTLAAFSRGNFCSGASVVTANEPAVDAMISTNAQLFRTRLMIAAIAVTATAGMSTSAWARLTLDPPPARLAQATQPLQSSPGAQNKPAAPAEPSTTGQRPHETPPQPARPDADAKDAGAKPALPPAPAEKTAPPIPAK